MNSRRDRDDLSATRADVVDDILYTALIDELRPPDIQSCIDDRARSWSAEEKRILALDVVRELLLNGWMYPIEPRPNPRYRDEQSRWEREWNYGPGPDMPSTVIWVPWDVSPEEAADRIAREWPADPYKPDTSADWQLELTPLGRKVLADKGIVE